jgi:hypothetical protein
MNSTFLPNYCDRFLLSTVSLLLLNKLEVFIETSFLQAEPPPKEKEQMHNLFLPLPWWNLILAFVE